MKIQQDELSETLKILKIATCFVNCLAGLIVLSYFLLSGFLYMFILKLKYIGILSTLYTHTSHTTKIYKHIIFNAYIYFLLYTFTISLIILYNTHLLTTGLYIGFRPSVSELSGSSCVVPSRKLSVPQVFVFSVQSVSFVRLATTYQFINLISITSFQSCSIKKIAKRYHVYLSCFLINSYCDILAVLCAVYRMIPQPRTSLKKKIVLTYG